MSIATLHPLVERLLREFPERDLSQEELAVELGVSPRTIIYWKKGSTPQPAHRRAIRAWLNGAPQEDVA